MTPDALRRAVSPAEWDRRLVAPGPLWRMQLLQAGLLVAIGLRLALRRWWTVAERSDEMFEPVAVLAWLDRPPGTLAVSAVWLVGVTAVVAGLLAMRSGRSPRLALVVAWTSLLFLAGLWGSGGKVLHNDVLLLTVAVPVLLAPSSRPWRREEVRWGWPPRAALAVLGVVYFLTGYQKLRHSGLEWVLSENMRWVLLQGDPMVSMAAVRGIAGQIWLTQLMAAGALLLELTAPLLLAVRRTRLLFAVSATVMHGAVWLLVGIDYWTWVLAVWAVVLPTIGWGERIAARSGLVERQPEMAGAR